MSEHSENSFTTGPLPAIFMKTALPIIFVMGMNGFLAVADALFLGWYVGPEALGAVTLMFPIYMLIVALATLVAGGMSSVLARHLGANRFDDARAVFAGAHGLALVASAASIVLYLVFGRQVTLLVAGGSETLAALGQVYLRITILFTPLVFILSVNSDALRNEGRIGLMAAMSLLVSLANIGFNYVLIAQLEMGVAGSAYGTAMAQFLAFVIILIFRFKGRTELHPRALIEHSLATGWGRILALGAPQSLNFVGLALGSASIVAALQLVQSTTYADTISAYGIVTRIMTFIFLPLLGLSHAMQSITGNNFGAEKWTRADSSLKIAMWIAFVYCLSAQIVLSQYAASLGAMFVDAPRVVAEVARILPMITPAFFLAGPLLIIAAYFQAIGDAGRAAILGLSKPYLFAIPLTFILAANIGETGIWIAGPLAEVMLFLLTIAVLTMSARRQRFRWGLFTAHAQVAS